MASTSFATIPVASSSSTVIPVADGGIQDTLKGLDYQVDLVKLFSLRYYHQNDDFECWIEDENAGKFDDVCIKVEDKSLKRSYTFVQAKHKIKRIEINLNSFLSDKNYELFKYFNSFLTIEDNFNINYADIDLSELVLCTNNKLKLRPFNNTLELEDPGLLGLNLYFMKLNNHSVYGKLGEIYKFDENELHNNFIVLRNIFLSFELADFLSKKNGNFNILKNYKTFLCNEDFDMISNSINIKNAAFKETLERLIDRSIIKIKGFNVFSDVVQNFKLDSKLISKIN